MNISALQTCARLKLVSFKLVLNRNQKRLFPAQLHSLGQFMNFLLSLQVIYVDGHWHFFQMLNEVCHSGLFLHLFQQVRQYCEHPLIFSKKIIQHFVCGLIFAVFLMGSSNAIERLCLN